MIAIGIDVGTARIGVAFNHGELILAHGIVQRTDSSAAEVADIALSRKAEAIFVGLPVALSGTETRSTADAAAFARELKQHTHLPIRLVDERLSTVSAATRLRSAGKNGKQARKVVDAEAARVILESALSAAKYTPLEELDA